MSIGKKPVQKPGRGKAGKGMVTLSTRINQDERDLIVKAANLRGWSPAQFVREAAFERAVHEINLATETQFDFREVGKKFADQLMSPAVWIEDNEGHRLDEKDESECQLTPGASDLKSEFPSLERAVRLGGTKFMEIVLEACRKHMPNIRSGLPQPIDPLGRRQTE